MDPEEKQLDDQMKARFARLPKVVQDAITSAEVEKHLRSLADTHKLHVDQWEDLENLVMMTLLGFETAEDLQANIKTEVRTDDTVARALAEDISKTVFEPIRQELERQLAHPEARAASVSDVEAARAAVLGQTAHASTPATPAVAPATPPAPPPTEKAVRAPVSEVYKPGEISSTRASVTDDPYREPPV